MLFNWFSFQSSVIETSLQLNCNKKFTLLTGHDESVKKGITKITKCHLEK